jgi:hypothetical protein
MGILDSLFGGKSSTGASQPKSGAPGAEVVDWQPDDAHLLFLSKFLIGQELQSMVRPYWEAPLREPPVAAIERFISMGWLVPATLAAKLGSRFKASDLKPLLKERGLRVSGRKEELIERLIAADQAGMTALVADMKVYECSDEARIHAEEYRKEQAQQRAKAEDRVLGQLRARDFRNASLTVAAFEAGQVFSRGIGIDWSKPNVDRDVEQLKAVYELRPKALDGLPETEWEPLRVATGMMALWGTSSAKTWLPSGFFGMPRFDNDTTARMLLFAANHKRQLAEYRQLSSTGIGVSRFEVSVTTDSCPACQSMAGRRYKLNELPELPHAACTHAYGCRCMAMPVFDA